MIQVENLSKIHGRTFVLNIPELYIPYGQSFGLVGKKGAGKTTFFNLLLRLIQPSTGQIVCNHIEINNTVSWKFLTTAFIDESFLISCFTPEEYFYFLGEMRGWDKAKVDQFLEGFTDFFDDEILNKRNNLSDLLKANSKKVGIVGALIGDPKVIILDEPFAYLDPATQIHLKGILKDLADNPDATLLISSPDLQHILEVSNRIVALEKGRVVKDIITSSETIKELEVFFSRAHLEGEVVGE
jgi:ABC-2 type transport system ATP-binding protein